MSTFARSVTEARERASMRSAQAAWDAMEPPEDDDTEARRAAQEAADEAAINNAMWSTP